MCKLVLGIDQNFVVDNRFYKTDWSSINHWLLENIFTLNLPLFLCTYSLLQINKRGTQIIIFLFLRENLCCGYSLEAPPWIPTTYVFIEKKKKKKKKKKISLGWLKLRLFYQFFSPFFFSFFFFFFDHKTRMTRIDSFEFYFFITCLYKENMRKICF